MPVVAEQLLAVNLDTIDEETVFFQLQSVFAHLMESRLQYYVPDKWVQSESLHCMVESVPIAFNSYTYHLYSIYIYLVSFFNKGGSFFYFRV